MPRQFRTRVQTSRAVKRATEWFASADVTAETSLGAGAAVLDQALTQAVLATISPATIVRTRGMLWVRTDQTAATEVPFGALGMALVSEQARVAGVASIPTPITDEADDSFFVHQFWLGALLVGAGGLDAIQPFFFFPFDSKAQRKIEDEAIVVTMENASSTHGIGYVLKFRMLFKLH